MHKESVKKGRNIICTCLQKESMVQVLHLMLAISAFTWYSQLHNIMLVA